MLMYGINNNPSENNFLLIVNSAKECLKVQNYIGALDIVLTLPDICGNVEYQNKKLGTGERYKKWYKAYIDNHESALKRNKVGLIISPSYDAEFVYKLRCSFLHQGETLQAYLKNKYNEVTDVNFTILFTIPNKNNRKLPTFQTSSSGPSWGPFSSGGKIEYTLSIDVEDMCKKIISAAEKFYDKNKNKFSDFKGFASLNNNIYK